MAANKKVMQFYDYMWGIRDSNNKYFGCNNQYSGWGYEQRRIHETIFEYISEINHDKTTKVLEVGCGIGDLTEKICKSFSNIIAFDLSDTGVRHTKKRAEKNCDCLVSDATNIPFKSDSFDIIIFSEVLEHIPEKEACIKEIRRVLKPDGYLILTTPNSGGFYRTVVKIYYKVLNRPYKPTEQIFDEPLSAPGLKSLVKQNFNIIRYRGLVYTIPYLAVFKLLTLVKISNRISELIENRRFWENHGLYQCILCRSVK